jgi:hypothetical protein
MLQNNHTIIYKIEDVVHARDFFRGKMALALQLDLESGVFPNQRRGKESCPAAWKRIVQEQDSTSGGKAGGLASSSRQPVPGYPHRWTDSRSG